MKVKEVPLRELLRGDIRFRVPPYQRRYSWRRPQFERLWGDIDNLLQHESYRHFMGTVVLEPEGKTGWLAVIDGQQRLATFTVLLKVLLDLFKGDSPDLCATIRAGLGSPHSAKFIPSLHDQDAFAVLRDNAALLRKVKHKHVRACYDYFYEVAESYIKTAPGSSIHARSRLLDVIFDRMFFIRISLTDKDDAQGIFETINYAGVPLTAADLARNFVLSLAKNPQHQEQINRDYWQKIEDVIEESLEHASSAARKAQLQKVLPEFLRAVLVVEQGKYVSFSDLYRQLRLFFQSGPLEEKLASTLEHAYIFRSCYKPDEYEKSKRLQTQLERFKELRMTTHIPVLLVLYRAYRAKVIGLTGMLDSMKYIESYVVRRAFNSKVSRDLNQKFADVAGELSKNPRSSSLQSILRASLKGKKWPDDGMFRTTFVSSPIYATAPNIARFVLVTLERSLANEQEISTGGKVQIEHVFPQQPGTGWDGDLTELKKNLHVIGNLTLTGYNSHYSNKSFKDKVKGPNGLKKSPYVLNKYIAKQPEWTARVIAKRANGLVGRAMKLWPGP